MLVGNTNRFRSLKRGKLLSASIFEKNVSKMKKKMIRYIIDDLKLSSLFSDKKKIKKNNFSNNVFFEEAINK